MPVESVLAYAVSFIFLGIGSGLILRAVTHFTTKIHASRLSVSFLVLGLLTSIPEIALGFSAASAGTPEIFIGNLIGGIAIIFFLIIPVLTFAGKGLSFPPSIDKKLLALTVVVCLVPSLFVIDRQVTIVESLSMIAFYIILTIAIESKGGVMEKKTQKLLTSRSFSFMDIVKILVGIVVVFISSHIILEQTHQLSQVLMIPDLVTSIIILSFGTNMPEISLAIKSVIVRKTDIALGDYLGSAAANTLIFGVLSLFMGGTYSIRDGLTINFFILLVGLILFYQFARTKWRISTKEALVLLILYFGYLGYWLTQK